MRQYTVRTIFGLTIAAALAFTVSRWTPSEDVQLRINQTAQYLFFRQAEINIP